MSRITVQSNHNRITVTNRLKYPETVNERALNEINSGEFEGLLPLDTDTRRKESRIVCTAQDLIPLDKYFVGQVSKSMFLEVAWQITLIVKHCEKELANSRNLDLQNDRVFIDPLTGKVKCIFWPVVNNQTSSPPQVFLKKLPYAVSFAPDEDGKYIERYAAFFEGRSPFSIGSFEKLLLELRGEKSEKEVRAPSEPLNDKQARKTSDETDTNGSIEYDPFKRAQEEQDAGSDGSVYCSSCGTKNQKEASYCYACGAKLTVVEEPGKNQRRSNTAVPIMPRLIRTKGGKSGGVQESTEVNKSVFKIGSDPSACDYVISGNNYISRVHAQILTGHMRYYIEDMGSLNKTYVNGKAIPPETKVELTSGAEVRLANVSFVFCVFGKDG